MNKFKELLFLKSISGIGNSRIHDNFLELLEEYSDLDDLISEIEFKKGIPYEKLEKAKVKAEEIYETVINDQNINAITIFDDDYPEQLNDMGKNKPVYIFVKGNRDALKMANIAVIGTRKPSDKSREFEENMVQRIVNETGRAVVSGLALGCDRIAHQSTVDENGTTIAVLPSGVNVIVPATNRQLAEDIIASGGCLVSEYNPDDKANKGTFVARDKIVAAFCDATLVVECGVKSGTMHTVNAARDYDRQIYAYLPAERPEGSYDGNEFILTEKEDAVEVEDIGEFINSLNNLKQEKKPKSVQGTLFDTY